MYEMVGGDVGVSVVEDDCEVADDGDEVVDVMYICYRGAYFVVYTRCLQFSVCVRNVLFRV